MSNRSSHLAHRFQTLPSALAAVPGSRRLLALAVVLALLALTLLPTAGQAQTPELPELTDGWELTDDRAPRNLLAQLEFGAVALRWLPPAEDAASVDGYEILRRRPNRDEPTLTTLVSDTGATDTTYFDATATESGVRYNYRVKAIRSGVRSDWSNYSTVLLPPSSPVPPLLVSNTGQSASATATITQQYAMGFRLGKHGQGYEISSVWIELAAAPSDLTVSLWIGGHPGHTSVGGVAQRKLFDFTNPTSFKVGLNEFTAPAGAFAYPNVNYFIVLSDFGSSLSIKETTSDAQDAGGETGAIIFDSAHLRALNKTGRWEGSPGRGSMLRLALEGSKRDRGILASTFAQSWTGGQEILSIGDDCCFDIRVGSADRYLIRGLSVVADNATHRAGFFGLPFELKKGSEKLFSLPYSSAQGDLADGPKKLTSPAGISEWTASQGATVEGGCPTITETETVTDEDGNETEVVRCKSYTFDMHITNIEGDDPQTTRGGVILSRIFGRVDGAHDAQYYDTPAPPGVTFSDHGSVALAIPHMAVDGEPLYAMVSNLEQSDNRYVSLGAEVSKVLSQSFTTGPVSYRLQGIGINIEGSDDSNGNPQVPGGPSSVSVAVHLESGGTVGVKLFDLVSPDEFRPGHSFFEAPPGTLLLPDTTYALVWSYLGGTWHRLQKTSSNDEDSGALPGFRIGGSFLVDASIDSLTVHSSGDVLEIALYGAATSDPMVSNLGQTDNGYVSLGGTNSMLSQNFTTGPVSYRLRGIGINIEGSDAQVPGGPSSVSVAVHLSLGDSVGVKVFDLVSPDEFEPGHSFFEAPPGALLEPNRTYAVVWSHLGGTPHRLQRTLSNDEDSGARLGFGIRDHFLVGSSIDSLSRDTAGNALEIALYGVDSYDPPFLDGSYQVNQRWVHLPDDVVAGDQFRLVFVTQDRTDAMSADIADYNALVQEEAAREYNHRIIRGAAPEFKAVVCTAAVDARTNTEIRDAQSVPVHWLDGGWDDRPTLIANSYYEFYSGVWINTEWGAIAPSNSTYFYERSSIWTGCDEEGVAHPEAHMGTTSSMRMVAVGTPGDTRREFGPLGTSLGTADYVTAEIDTHRRIYAISPVFTVIAGP